MTEEATRQGAEKTVGNANRTAAMNDIVEKARQARQLTMGEPNDNENEEVANGDPALADNLEQEGEVSTAPVQEAVEPEKGEDPDTDPEDMVTIVVDGEERQVSRSKIYEQGVRTMQKESAADKRLAEAAERVRQADLYAAQSLARVEAQLRASQQEKNQGEPLSKKQDVDVKTRARKIIASILDGTEEEAAEALAEAMAGRSDPTPQVDTGSIVQETTKRVQRQIEHTQALRDFRTNFNDIADDPHLYNMADQETLKVHQEHPDWGLTDILNEAGSRVRKWVKSKTTVPSSADAERAAKLARKSAIDNPKAASARAPVAVEEKPPSRSDIVASMRKARGYAT